LTCMTEYVSIGEVGGIGVSFPYGALCLFIED
jgi:hypothetical protein